MVLLLIGLRNLRTVFPRGCTNLLLHQQYTGVFLHIVVYISLSNHSNRCEVITLGGFGLHFRD